MANTTSACRTVLGRCRTLTFPPAEDCGKRQRQDGSRPDREADVMQHRNFREREQAEADQGGSLANSSDTIVRAGRAGGRLVEKERVIRSDRDDQQQPHQMEDGKRLTAEREQAGRCQDRGGKRREHVEYPARRAQACEEKQDDRRAPSSEYISASPR